jgi:hypothetical protein
MISLFLLQTAKNSVVVKHRKCYPQLSSIESVIHRSCLYEQSEAKRRDIICNVALLEKWFIRTPGYQYWCRLVIVVDTNNDWLISRYQ